jgi:hypothetical protein
VTALLVQEAEPWVSLLQTPQGCQRLPYPVQASLVGSDQVQGVAVLGRSNRKCFGCGERFRVPTVVA